MLSIGLAVALAGCASPYVRVPLAPTAEANGPPSLDDAVRYAHGVQAQYRDKLVELGQEERTLSTGLLGLAGAVLGMGVLGAHSSVIKGASVAGGTVFTAGEFATDKNRAAVYGAGMEAINCAVGMVSPIQFSTGIRQELKAQLGANPLRSAVLTGADSVAQLMASARVGSTVAAQAALDDANDKLAENSELSAAAGVVLLRHEQAGPDLRNAVLAIDTQVSNAVRALEVDIRSVRDAISRLAENSAVFGRLATQTVTAAITASPMSKSVPAAASDLPSLNAAVGKLRLATAELAHQNRRLADLLDAMEQDAASGLRTCKASFPFLVVTVTPSTATFTATAQQTLTAKVSGGQISNNRSASYTATFLATARGLVPSIQGNRLFIAKASGVAPGTYTLRVEEAKAGTFVDVPVIVQGAATSTPGTNGAGANLADAKKAIDGIGTASLDSGAKFSVDKSEVKGSVIEVRYSVVQGAVTPEEVLRYLLSVPDVDRLKPENLTLLPS